MCVYVLDYKSQAWRKLRKKTHWVINMAASNEGEKEEREPKIKKN